MACKISKSEFECSINDLFSKISEGPSFKIEYKSNDFRKFAYILVNSDGFIWLPKTTNSYEFSDGDENPFHEIIGSRYDKDIFSKISNKQKIINKGW